MIEYFQNSTDTLIAALLEHMELTLAAIIIAIILAGIITVWLEFYPALKQSSVYLLSLMYAVPSFALFALLIPWTGLGKTTAVIVLVIYAQYTLVRNFTAGIAEIDAGVMEAAVGMGMNKWQLLYKIQLPLAKGAIFAGIRLATASVIAITAIAATINAGGLGVVIFEGLRTMSLVKILWGILLTILWSGVVNLVLYLIEELLRTGRETKASTILI